MTDRFKRLFRTANDGRSVITSAPCAAIFCCTLLASTIVRGQTSVPASPEPDMPMSQDPSFPKPVITRSLDARYKAIWAQALSRPDAETRRVAADAIGEAAVAGAKGLDEFAPRLLSLLDGDHRAVVRLAAARALFRIGARDSAPKLIEHAKDDWEMLLLADQASAAWDFAPARAGWLERLKDPATARLSLLSAARAAGAVRDRDAAGPLGQIASDRSRDPALRLTAAEQVAHIGGEGIEASAAAMVEKADGISDRLIAATMLSGSRSDAAIHLLLKLADDPEPAVEAVAIRHLIEVDPKLLAPLNDKLAASADSNVRLLAVQAFAGQRTEAAVDHLARLLDDVMVKVRVAARGGMMTVSSDAAAGGAVRAAAARVAKDSGHWRGAEQAVMIFGLLKEQEAAQLITDLLAAERPEVRIAAVIAVRQVPVIAALPVLRQRVDAIEKMLADPTDAVAMKRVMDQRILDELNQIVQDFGVLRDQEADALLQGFIPKKAPFGDARAGAIWSLGMLHASQPDPKLVNELLARAKDQDINTPENPVVQAMCLISLGRMKAQSAATAIAKLISSPDMAGGDLLTAGNWALQQITGQAPPELPPAEEKFGAGPLTPAN